MRNLDTPILVFARGDLDYCPSNAIELAGGFGLKRP